MAEHHSHTVRKARMNVGYQMAYACWVRRRFGAHPFVRATFFGWWAQMQGQLDNPRPYLLSDEDESPSGADYDGAPYCSHCGARKRQFCKCGPIPSND